jgi:hypothetical protein
VSWRLDLEREAVRIGCRMRNGNGGWKDGFYTRFPSFDDDDDDLLSGAPERPYMLHCS